MLCVPVWHRHPTPFFLFVLFAWLFCYTGAGVMGGVIERGDTLEGFRIDWCFRRGLYESEGGVACQHLVLWNSRADFPCQ